MQYAFTIQYMIYELFLHQEGVGGGDGAGVVISSKGGK